MAMRPGKSDAALSLRKLEEFLSSLPMAYLEAFLARLRWMKSARPEQLAPDGAWRVWLILAGRGWGKTRTGAEDIAFYSLWHENVRVGIVAPTFSDARDVCVEGESGVLRLLPESCVKAWHRSTGDLLLVNGSRIKLFSADQPERLRGPQHHRVWCDELGAWPRRDAFDQMWFGLRLGDDPRVVVTTTPRNTALLRELVGRQGGDIAVTRGRTMDNSANLSGDVLAHLMERYAGTRLGRQELEAEFLQETEGALWERGALERIRILQAGALARVVVAVDPALSHGAASDETGLVVAGLGADGLFYVLADASGRFSADGWSRRAVQLYQKFEASLIVAEVNAGGDLVERVLRQQAPPCAFKAVRAVRGKMERAYPVASLYEQGRVRHCGGLDLLEDQMCCFSEDGIAAKSPDRVDALVWALTELAAWIGQRPRIHKL